METILCILLYLGAIFSPGVYSVQEVDRLTYQHEAEIKRIQYDDARTSKIVREYTPCLGGLDIIEPNED